MISLEDIRHAEGYEQAQNILAGNGEDIQVFVGMIQNGMLKMRWLAYDTPVKTFDDVLSTIILRGRPRIKAATSLYRNKKEAEEASAGMSLEGVYHIDVNNYLECSKNTWNSNVPPNVIIFFLDEKSQWQMFSSCAEYLIETPKLVKSVYKDYYTEFYPKQVVDFAFADPKDIKRVYDFEEVDDHEDYFMESLFIDSDVTEHVYVPIAEPQNQAA